jgi:hypothetical protein
MGCTTTKVVDMGGDEGTAVAGVVDLLNDYKADDARIQSIFATGTSLPPATELNKYSFYIVGKPKVENDSATSTILVEKMDGTPVGEREWTFKKVGGNWKIASAMYQ